MVGDLKYLAVNWIDGMKISRKHFEETENFVQDQIRDGIAQHLTDYNFGILPAENSLDLSVSCDFSQQINIELKACKAITPNGSRIQILPEDAIRENTNFKTVANRFGLQLTQPQNIYIILSVNLFKRVPTGEPDVEETPPRHPFTRPEIKLDLIPAEQINTGKLADNLVIGKISFQNGELIFQKDFIPSCTSVKSLPSLMNWYSIYRHHLENWELYCIKIVQKINSKSQSQQPNSLASSILRLSEKILEQLVLEKQHFLWIIPSTAPIYLCNVLLKIIQYLHAVVLCYAEKDREEMLNYFAEWTDVQTGTIENLTQKALLLQYNHYDIHAVLSEISQVYSAYIQIFMKLSQLDFIGKKKGQNIFVIEQEVKENKQSAPPPIDKPNNRWSPLS